MTATMATVIHPTALVSSDARLGEGVQIGAFAIVGEQCVVGDGCVLGARSTLERNATLGPSVRVGSSSVVGGDPQDLKFGGEETFVEIGEGTVIREFVTVNRGTADGGRTTVGSHCLLMSYVHVAHDCHVGNHVIISNGSQLAGHVTLEDRVNISGLCGIHQFVRVGRHSFIGGASRVQKDVPPFVRASGNPLKMYGLNAIGLQRSGFSPETLAELKRVYRLLFRSDLTVSRALEQAAATATPMPEVQAMLDFVRASGRGVGL